MAEGLFIEIEAAQYTKSGQAACGDDVRIKSIESEGRYLAVLSDGLGSGVKAHVLSTMTTTMALKFLESDIPVAEAAEIIMDSLPVCEVRKIGYATFSLFDFRLGGRARVVEMGNPGNIHLRGTAEVAPVSDTRFASPHWPDRRMRECILPFEPGDRVILCSDGVTQSGMGERKDMKFGWRRAGVLKFAQEKIAGEPDISARDLSRAIAARALMLSPGGCKDDISCLVAYLRRPRVLRVLTGPPFRRESDGEYARLAQEMPGHVIVCGGTTASILERELGVKVQVDLRDLKNAGGLPPAGKLPGIGIATEGVLTLSRVLEALEEGDAATIAHLPTAARMVADMFLGHDAIEFAVGTKVNESHWDPSIPQDLELRRSLVRRIANILARRYRKKTSINFW